jgi:hypothetical protein
MFEFLAGFIVGINVGLFVWSLLRIGAIQGPDACERQPAPPVVQDPARATSGADWVWVT